MADFIEFDRIISYVIKNCGSIPLKFLRENVIGVLSRFSYQKNILRLAIDLQNKETHRASYKLFNLQNQGVSSKNFNCSKCQDSIQSDEMMKGEEQKFLLFMCGHAFHSKCLKNRVCEVCEKDFRKSWFSINK